MKKPKIVNLAAEQRLFNSAKSTLDWIAIDVQKQLKSFVDKSGIRALSPKANVKEWDRIEEKFHRKDKYLSIRTLPDLVRARITTLFLHDAYAVARLLCREPFLEVAGFSIGLWPESDRSFPVPIHIEEIEDKSVMIGVNEFGYSAIHLQIHPTQESREKLKPFRLDQITIEVQVCSSIQAVWADCQHDILYKLDEISFGELPIESKRRLYRAAALLEMADAEFETVVRHIDEYSRDVRNR